MRRYNIVLTPKSTDCSIFEEFSQKHFSQETSGYLLGNESIPHITLCQFECEEAKFPVIAAEIAKVNVNKSYSPVFQGLSLIKLGGQFAGQHAAQFSVARTQELLGLQRRVVDVVQSLGINPLNALGDQYSPHLTLAFFYPEQAKDSSIPIVLPSEIFESREFSVSIGLADHNWQFNKSLINFF